MKAELGTTPRTLHFLWKFEINGKKSAKEFTKKEQDGKISINFIWKIFEEISLQDDTHWEDFPGFMKQNLRCVWTLYCSIKDFKLIQRGHMNGGNHTFMDLFV